MAKSMIGVDIGACYLKLVQWDGSRIRKAVRAATPDNLVQGGRIVSYEAMADFIKETLKKYKLSGKSCAVILPSEHAFLRRMTMPAMTTEQLQVNLPYEFRDFLSMPKDKYFYDYAVNSLDRDEEGKPAQLDLTAAAVPIEVIEDYRDMFRRAGLKLHTAIPAECAYANLLFRGNLAKESCILDLGHTSSRITIFSGHAFDTTRTMDVGMETLDRAIADTMEVDEHMARSYKESNYKDSLTMEPAQNIYGAIAADLRKAVNFYGFNNRDSNLQDIWYCGGGANIPPLLEEIGRAVDLTLHPIEELLPPAPENEDELNFYAAAVGAAIQ